MSGRLHSHGFNELAEGWGYKGKVIVDAIYEELFSVSEVYDKSHIIVDWEEFIKNGGEVRFVSIRKNDEKNI